MFQMTDSDKRRMLKQCYKDTNNVGPFEQNDVAPGLFVRTFDFHYSTVPRCILALLFVHLILNDSLFKRLLFQSLKKQRSRGLPVSQD